MWLSLKVCLKFDVYIIYCCTQLCTLTFANYQYPQVQVYNSVGWILRKFYFIIFVNVFPSAQIKENPALTSNVVRNFHVPGMATQLPYCKVQIRHKRNSFLVSFIFSCRCPLPIVSPLVLPINLISRLVSWFGFAVSMWPNMMY